MARIVKPTSAAGTNNKRQGGVTLPYTPIGFNAPPAGTYNPQIQQEVERSRRGIDDLLEKLELEGKRTHQDTAQKRREIALGRRQSVSDQRRQLGYDQADLGYHLGQLGINFTRSLGDLGTAKLRGQEDYSRTLTNLQHEYGARAEQQTQNAIQAGTNDLGTSTASSAVRAANQGHDKANIDLSHQRSEEDFATREGRLREDYAGDVARSQEGFGRQQTAAGININRAGDAATRQQHALSLAALRAAQERATKASHAEREQGIYETNAGEDAYYEAHQLHPNVQFPGGSNPAAPTKGPHVGNAVPAPNPVEINIGRGRRLASPRY
jgi:hypothetical protein